MKITLLYVFTATLLFQNSASLLLSAALNISTTPIFLIKEMLVALMLLLTLVSNRVYRVTHIDILVALMFFLIIFVTAINFNGLMPSITGIRMYCMPFALYIVGRYLYKDLDYDELSCLLVIISGALIIMSIFYWLVADDSLRALNIDKLFISKGQDPSGYRFLDELPVNFYSYYRTERIKRVFGVFMDPLSVGFFCVPILFYFRYSLSNDSGLGKWILYFAALLLLLLSSTRAIILSYIMVNFMVRYKKGKLFIISLKYLAIAVVIFLTFISLSYDYLISKVDPSSYGHLYAYFLMVQKIEKMSFFHLVLGNGIPLDMQVGTESLFGSILIYYGALTLLLFLLILYKLFKQMQQNVNTFNVLVLSSLLVYFLASFTTEHWFATTSSGLFWLILGIAIGSQQQQKGILVIL